MHIFISKLAAQPLLEKINAEESTFLLSTPRSWTDAIPLHLTRYQRKDSYSAKSSEDQMHYLKDGISEQLVMNVTARTSLLSEGKEKSGNKSLQNNLLFVDLHIG